VASRSFPKKIAIVLSDFPVISETFIALQVAHLLKKNKHVKIYNIGKIGNYAWLPKGLDEHIKEKDIIHVNKHADDNLFMPLIHLLFKSPISTLKLLFSNPFPEGRKKTINTLFYLEQLTSFDVVHFQFITIADQCLKYKSYGFLKKQENFFCSIRGYDVTKDKFNHLLNWELIFKHIKVFLPVCDFLKNKLKAKKHFNNQSLTENVYSPINIDNIPNKNDSQETLITFISVGRLVEKKGIDIALKALSVLKDNGEKFQYTIIGDGPDLDILQAQTSQLNLTNEVHFLGALPSTETLEIMTKHQILLMPSKTAKDGDCEGIPNVIKEAMHMGLQVISTTHAGIPELIKNEINGYICLENDNNSFLQGIYECIHNKSNWNDINNNARNTICEGFTPDKTTEQLLKAYNSIL